MTSKSIFLFLANIFLTLFHSNEISHFIEEKKLPIQSTSAVHTVGGKRNSARKTDKYFSELSKTQVTRLYEIYKFDFQLFGYDHQKFIDLAKNDTETTQSKGKTKDEFDLALEELKQREKGKYHFEERGKKNKNSKGKNMKKIGKFQNEKKKNNLNKNKISKPQNLKTNKQSKQINNINKNRNQNRIGNRKQNNP